MKNKLKINKLLKARRKLELLTNVFTIMSMVSFFAVIINNIYYLLFSGTYKEVGVFDIVLFIISMTCMFIASKYDNKLQITEDKLYFLKRKN